MTDRHVVEGSRSTVVVDREPGGWSWHCQGCDGVAGRPSRLRHPNGKPYVADVAPFVDKEIAGVRDTGEGHAVRSALAHANTVCAGQAARDWKPSQ